MTRQGLPRVSYCACDPLNVNKSILHYAVYDGFRWQIETADNIAGSGIASSLQLDALGQPHVAYFRLQSWTSHQLYYAQKIGSTWYTEVVHNTSSANAVSYFFCSLDLDNSSQPHIAYSDGVPTGYYVSRTSWLDSDRLTFASYRNNNWEVYTANADGTNQVRRTVNPAYDSTPKLNRGANRISFVSNRDGNNEIYVMNADGSGQTRLTNTPTNEYWPNWSPDGSKIAFYSYRDGNAEIYVMNADGSNQTRLTSSLAWDGHPVWSSGGAQLGFASERSGASDLWIMNADGTNQHQLTFGLNAAYPDWSPDGSRIIFNDDTNNDGWLDIAMINADGTNLTHPLGYSPANYDYASPNWSPTGQDYVFSNIQWTYYQGNYYWVDAYLYGVSAGSAYQLTSSGLDWWPDWQTTDVWAPTSQVNSLPSLLNTTQLTVKWSGADVGPARVMSYDIQYRDGLNGTWTNWLAATSQTSAAFNGTSGHTYYFRSRARDYANNLEAYSGGNGDTYTTVDTIAPVSSASAPLYAASLQIPVTWSGADPVSGIAAYDIQVRDGAGTWTDWLISTTNTSSVYLGQLGHTYYFQSRARDKAGNLETYPGGDGDTVSHAPLYSRTTHCYRAGASESSRIECGRQRSHWRIHAVFQPERHRHPHGHSPGVR